MKPFSILMFCFSGALFAYAALIAVTKDERLIARNQASKANRKDGKAYAALFAKVLALVAVAPAHAGIAAALYSEGIGMVVLIAEMIFWIWVATRLMRE